MNSMIIYLYCVKDLVSGTFVAPMHFLTDVDAIRWFRTQCYSDPVLYHNRSDYELVCIGTFDREVGDFMASPRSLINGSSITKMVVEEQADQSEDLA